MDSILPNVLRGSRLRLTDVTQPIRTNATGQPATVGVVVRVAVVVIVAEGYPKAPTTREVAVPESTAEVAAAEMAATHATAEVAATHATAEVTATTAAAEVTSATAAAVAASTAAASTTCKRVGSDAGASHRQGGNDDRDFVQRKFPHDASFPIETTSVIARTPVAVRRSIEVAND